MAPNDPDPPIKRVKLSENTAPPPYGSKKYWDDRYKQNKLSAKSTSEGQLSGSEATVEEPQETEGDSYHSWYFTYEDLKPLILPLIVGEKMEEEFSGEESNRDGNSTDVIDQNLHRESEKIKSHDKAEDAKQRIDTNTQNGVISEEGQSDREGDDEDDVHFDEEIEIVEDEEESELPERIGVARDGAISVLEVGCGDVPLGKELAVDIINFQNATKSNVVKQIICMDYSSAVVRMMLSEKHAIEGLRSKDLEVLDSILQFQVVDARKMPYENDSFELLLEKGTLDAMLSDKVDGIKNCQAIMAECGRVLATGGYIVLVSHLNAHTNDGIDWLNQVVLTGLRSGSKNVRWEIEVHGNDVDESSSGNPGPCVYIIQKLNEREEENTTVEDKEQIGLHLRFFSY